LRQSLAGLLSFSIRSLPSVWLFNEI
jgi:hypothetical protein